MAYFYKRQTIEDDMQLNYTYPDFFDASATTTKITSSPENSMYAFKIPYTFKPSFGDSELVGSSIEIHTTAIERNVGVSQPTLKVFSVKDDLNTSGDITSTDSTYPFGRLSDYTVFSSKTDYKSKLFEEDFSGWENDTVYYNNTRRAFDGSALDEPYALLGELEDSKVWDFNWYSGHGIGTTWSEYAVDGKDVGVNGDVVFFEHNNKGTWFGLGAKQGIYEVRSSERGIGNDPTIWENNDSAAYIQLESILKWNKKTPTVETYEEDVAIHPDNSIFNKSYQCEDFMTIHADSGDTIPLAQTSLVINNEKYASGGSSAKMSAYWANRDEGIATSTQTAAASNADGIGNETVCSWKIQQDTPSFLKYDDDKAFYDQENLQTVMLSTNKVPFPTPLGIHETTEGVLGEEDTDLSGHRVVLTGAIDSMSPQWVADNAVGAQGTLYRSVAFTFSEMEPIEGEDLTSYLMRHEPQYAGTALAKSGVDTGTVGRIHGGTSTGGVIGIKDTSGTADWTKTTGRPVQNDTLCFNIQGAALGDPTERYSATSVDHNDINVSNSNFQYPSSNSGDNFSPPTGYTSSGNIMRYYNQLDWFSGLQTFSQNNVVDSTRSYATAGGWLVYTYSDGASLQQNIASVTNGSTLRIKARVGSAVTRDIENAYGDGSKDIMVSIEADVANNGTWTRLHSRIIKPNRRASGTNTPDSDSGMTFVAGESTAMIDFGPSSRQPSQPEKSWQDYLLNVGAVGYPSHTNIYGYFSSPSPTGLKTFDSGHDYERYNKHFQIGYEHKGQGQGGGAFSGRENLNAHVAQERLYVMQDRFSFAQETNVDTNNSWTISTQSDEHFYVEGICVAQSTTVPVRVVVEKGPDWDSNSDPTSHISEFKVEEMTDSQEFIFKESPSGQDQIDITATADAQATEIAAKINAHSVLSGFVKATAVLTNHANYLNFSSSLTGTNDKMPQVHLCFGGAQRAGNTSVLSLPGENGNRFFMFKSHSDYDDSIRLFGGLHPAAKKTSEVITDDTNVFLRGGSKSKSLIGFSVFQREGIYFVDSLMHTFDPDTIMSTSSTTNTDNLPGFTSLDNSDYFKTHGSDATNFDYQMKYRWEFGTSEAKSHSKQGATYQVATNPDSSSTGDNSPGSHPISNYATIPSKSAYKTNIKSGNFYDFSFEFNTNESDFYLHILEKGSETPVHLIPVSNTIAGSGSTRTIDANVTNSSLLYQDDDDIPTIKKFIGCRNFATVSKSENANREDFGTGIVGQDPMDVQPDNYRKSADGRHLKFPNVFTIWVNNIKYTGKVDWDAPTESDGYWNDGSKNLNKPTETTFYADSLKFFGFENGVNRTVTSGVTNYNLALSGSRTKLPYKAWDDNDAFVYSSTNWIIGHDNKDLIGGTNYIPVHFFFHGFQVSDLTNNDELNPSRFWAGYSGRRETLGNSWSPSIFRADSSEDGSFPSSNYGIDIKGNDGTYSPELSIGYGTSQLEYDVEGFTQKGVMSLSYKENAFNVRTKREHILASSSIIRAVDSRRFSIMDASKFKIGDSIRIYKVSESAIDASGNCTSVIKVGGGTIAQWDRVEFTDDNQVFNISAIGKDIVMPDVSTSGGSQISRIVIEEVKDIHTIIGSVTTATHMPTSSFQASGTGYPLNYYTVENWTGNYIDTTVNGIDTNDGTNPNVITVAHDISGHITPDGDRYGNESLAGWKAGVTKFWFSLAYIPSDDDEDVNRVYSSMCGVPPQKLTGTNITDPAGQARVVTCANHGLSTNDKIVITDCSISTVNNKKWLITKVDNDSFSIRTGESGGFAPKRSITAASRSGTTVTVTSSSHGYTTGDKLSFAFENSVFDEELATITVTDANTYTYTATAGQQYSDAETTNTAATGRITIAGRPADNKRITLTDTAGNSVIYEFDQAGTQADGTDYSSNVIQVGAATGGGVTNSTYATRLIGAINNTSEASNSLTLNITATALAGVITLTQDTAGKAGNRAIVSTDTHTETCTITVTDYANIEVGTAITLTDANGITTTFTSEALSGSAAGGTNGWRPNTDNNTTADNIYAAINAHADYSAANPAANVITVTRRVKGSLNNTVTSSDNTRVAVTNFTDSRTVQIESISGGSNALVGDSFKSLYGSAPGGGGTSGDTDITIYNMQPAFNTLGGTVNEFIYSDAYINNPHILSLNTPDNTIVELTKDYGFGAFDKEKTEGGHVGQKIAASANTDYRIELDSAIKTDSIEFGQTKNYIMTNLNTLSKNVITIATSKNATVSNKPVAIFKMEDEIPAPPSDFNVKPHKDNEFYPEFTWTSKADDTWYGLLLVSDQSITNQYHDAIIHLPLNETGKHASVATAPTENISGLTTIISGPLYSEEGLAGNCLTYDGTNDYVRCGTPNTNINTAATNDATSTATTELSIVTHIIPNSGGSDDRYIISQEETNGRKFSIYLNSSNQVVAKVYRNDSNHVEVKSSSIIVTDGETPTSVILTVDTTLPSGNIKLFINGKLEDISGVALEAGTVNNWQIDATMQSGNSYVVIGNSSHSSVTLDRAFDGKLEEMVVYKKCIYPVSPSDTNLLFTKPISELVSGQTLSPSKSNTARLFIKDYHNIRGKTSGEVSSSPQISWRKAGFALDTS